jgi:molybdopterin adenylyltransferase
MTPPDRITAAILTCSDRCSAGGAPDLSGPLLAKLVAEKLHATVVISTCIPDDADAIKQQLLDWATQSPCPDLILTTGGTGLSPRDVTPEATLAVLERQHPGLLELARARCAVQTPLAYLSRGVAGTIRRTLIINLPGSPKGVSEMFNSLVDVLPHAVKMLRGDSDHSS